MSCFGGGRGSFPIIFIIIIILLLFFVVDEDTITNLT